MIFTKNIPNFLSTKGSLVFQAVLYRANDLQRIHCCILEKGKKNPAPVDVPLLSIDITPAVLQAFVLPALDVSAWVGVDWGEGSLPSKIRYRGVALAGTAETVNNDLAGLVPFAYEAGHFLRKATPLFSWEDVRTAFVPAPAFLLTKGDGEITVTPAEIQPPAPSYRRVVQRKHGRRLH
jgi:hypothetical protein